MGSVSPEPGTPSGCGLPDEAASLLEGAGFNVAGRLSIEAYDARVPLPWRKSTTLPEAADALVLGTGGGTFERTWAASAGAPPATDPADEFARGVLDRATSAVEAATGAAARAFLYGDRCGGEGAEVVFADFVALAEACRLGRRSRLGLLLHPVHGAWWSVRALVLVGRGALAAPGRLEAPAEGSTCDSPCMGCPAPCVAACPGEAVLASGFLAERCAATRLEGTRCTDRCDARRACIVAPEQAYPAAAEQHYARTSLGWLSARADALAGEGAPC